MARAFDNSRLLVGPLDFAYLRARRSIARFIEAYALDAAGDRRYESLATLILKGVETTPASPHELHLHESLAKSLSKLILERKLTVAEAAEAGAIESSAIENAYRGVVRNIAGFIEAYGLDAARRRRYESLATLILEWVETAPADPRNAALYESLAKSLSKLILERKLTAAEAAEAGAIDNACRGVVRSVAGFIEAGGLSAAGDSRYASLAKLILELAVTAPTFLHDVDILYESLAKSLAKLILERKLLPADQDRAQ